MPALSGSARKKLLERDRRSGLPWQFWRQVDKTETCWLWIGNTNNNHNTAPGGESYDYGEYECAGHKTKMAHRIAVAETFKCDVPAELDVSQTCGNRLCVSPDHLTVVDNRLRGEEREQAKIPVAVYFAVAANDNISVEEIAA